MYLAPWYVWALALTGVIGIPVAASAVLQRGASLADVRPRPIGLLAAALAGGWIAVSTVLAVSGLYGQAGEHAAPWFGVAFAAGLGGAILLARLPAVRRALNAAGMTSRLTLPHTIRVVGAVFVILMAQGQLPAVFALPAGLGDIAVGLSAPFVARRLALEPGARAGMRFHILGLADLVVALAIGFLAGLGPIRLFHAVPSALVLSHLPLALIPTVAVPMAIALHVTTIVRMRAHQRRAAPAEGGTRRVIAGESRQEAGNEGMALS